VTRITVRVTPRASRNEILGWGGDALRVRVTAAPTEGKANQAVIALLAKALDVPKASITLASGSSSRTKILALNGVTAAEIRARLAGGR
jgi:uncharacterized protein (TIGR00251 family)